MEVLVHADKAELGRAAAAEGAAAISAAISSRGAARIILATGASQFEMLDALTGIEIDWGRVTAFHLDEYVGLPPDHPAGFRRYLQERFLDRLGTPPAFVAIDGGAAVLARETARLGALIGAGPIDVCFAGIGENGHLAFNDPPADFETREPYLVVALDDACRRQQLGEGWFASLADVPTRAISMSVRQIMASARIVLSVPDARKAEAVRNTVEGPVTPLCPASIVQEHPAATLHLDAAAAQGLHQ